MHSNNLNMSESSKKDMEPEFKARVENGVLVIEPIIIKEGNNTKVIVPSLDLITKFKKEVNNGKRDL